MTPIAGAAAVTVHEGHVLLVQRRNTPDAGLWGYPGGHVETGETDAQAATRELREETSVIALPRRTLAVLHVGDDSRRFRLTMVACDYLSGEPRADDDAMAAEWVAFAQVFTPDRAYSDRVADVLRMALRD
ncbi:Bifunctional NMN adenylyltransferase/Nudix hydrolase [Rhodobacteraceae bacterium THAF1]|uniref:NUDIX hydrolase n=1 Tax=Palleronia sp. THAF1 TaxID=2587842 RepID=UPI000F3FCFA6|nr:NUDIX hydrolase [Palleronia sp. THAF1]QFU08863.1 Bifunctional NMN adenylyltransferase/Nudix hydrolase [Palleronia sp. THAF1]VDC24425.1 Bifunctional NMN adenylyltransferase/Nudix hydrolase [Rhodobacteraceae bacterium THAF1]